MPERVSEATACPVRRGRRSLRVLVFAGLLAAVTTLVSAGVASADYWPHTETWSPAAAQQNP